MFPSSVVHKYVNSVPLLELLPSTVMVGVAQSNAESGPTSTVGSVESSGIVTLVVL